jgi:hypothetical protein
MMEYVIELTVTDQEGYKCKEYFDGVYADDFGIVRVATTSDPLSAKRFATVEPENRNSVLTVIKNVMRNCTINVRRIKFTLE